MGWNVVIYTSFSFLCLAFRIEADIILSNGTHIMRTRHGTEEYTVIRQISGSTSNPVPIPSLAVDWRDEQLFWFEVTDIIKAMHKSNLDGSLPTIIITKDIENVTSITVDDLNKILYWSDSRKETIERADYDGKNGRIIHSKHLYGISVLAVDPIHGLLYWNEERFSQIIYSSKTDGGDPKIAHIFNLTQERLLKVDIEIRNESDADLLLYWRDVNSTLSFSNCSVLFQCRMQNLTTEMTDVLRSVSFAIKPNYPRYQREGVCKNMGCSHVCIPMNETYARCSCPFFGGLVLVSEKNCSTVTEPFLLYSDYDKGYIGITDLYPRYSSPDYFLVANQKKPRGLAYDNIAKMVYFYEEVSQSIFKIKIDGTDLKEVLRFQEGHRTNITALAVDSVQRRLYIMSRDAHYLSNEFEFTTIRIEVLDLESNHRRTVIVGEDINPNILFILHDRLHFVRNWTCILSDMDGFNEKQGFCSTNVSIDTFIAKESPLNFVVFEHNKSEIIVRQRGVNIDIWQGQMKTTSALTIQGVGRFAIATTIISRHGTSSVCDKNAERKTCGGLCFRTQNETIARCHCPTYKFNVLQEDVRTCSAPDEYLLFTEGREIRMMGRGRTPDTSVYTIAESTHGDIESFAFRWPYVYFITRTESLFLYRLSVNNSQTETVAKFSTPGRLLQVYDDRLYWLSHDGNNLTVRSVSLDGKEPVIHLERNLRFPNSYAFDAHGNIFIIFQQRMIVLRQTEPTEIPLYTSDAWNPTAAIIDDENRILYVATSSNTIEYMSAIPERLLYVRETLGLKRINIQAPSPDEASITSMTLSAGRLYVILKSLQKRRAILMTIDLRMTSIGRTEEINAYEPRGLFAFIQDNRDSFEPGKVMKTGSCPSTLQKERACTEYECITDYGCGGNGAICCRGSEMLCNTCVRPVSANEYIDATCKTCTNGTCNHLICPPIGDCNVVSKLNCCPICLDITECSDKPIIEGCPNDVFNLSLPDNSDSVQIDTNVHQFNAISAHDCSPVRRHIRVELRNKSLTWQNAVQYVDVIAKDMNGESVCKVSVRVKDVTSPWFQSCPSNMEFYSKDQFTSATWFDPVAADNVAKPPRLLQEDKHYQSPMEVSVGTVYSMKYIAKDDEGNIGQPCSFTISALKLDTSCSSPPQIQQGSLFCIGDPDAMECHIRECAKDFILMPEFNQTYRCQNGNWVPPFNDSFQTGACLKMEFLSLAMQLNVDLLNKDTETPTKDDVIECFHKLSLCPERKTNEFYRLCTEKNIQLIRKENILQLELNTTRQLRFNETVEDVESELNKTITALSLGFSERAISTYCLKLTGQIQKMSQEAYIFCEPGSILLPSKINCTLCPPGEYEAGSTCRQCPRGYYTNLPGQTECVKCEDGTTTHRLASYSKNHCVSMAATPSPSSDSNNTFLIIIIGIISGTVLLLSIVVAVTVYRVKKAKKSHYPTGAFMDETYLSLSCKTNENPYDNRKSVYDEIPADIRM